MAVQETTMSSEESMKAAKFEKELCWCLEQLHIQMSSETSKTKLLEAKKVEKRLLSASTPFIKKRQLMSLHFGDYRKIMAEEDEKNRIDPDKVSVSKVDVQKQNGVFYRAKQTNKCNQTSINFQFNFPQPNQSDNTT